MSVSLPQPNDIPKDKQEILTLGFSLSVHVLRTFYLDLLDKITDLDKRKTLNLAFNELLPEVEPGGFLIRLGVDQYKMMYMPISNLAKYNLDDEINKIPNLGSLSDYDKNNLKKEIDICASSIPSINQQLIRQKEFIIWIKNIFDEFDLIYEPSLSDNYKDIDLKIISNQRIYHMAENGPYFGIFIQKLIL